MVIYLSHPEHGTKVAICEEEAKADEKNGWERMITTSPAYKTLHLKRPYNKDGINGNSR